MPAWIGTKKELCRQCIQTIGLDATYNAARKWCRKQYGAGSSMVRTLVSLSFTRFAAACKTPLVSQGPP